MMTTFSPALRLSRTLAFSIYEAVSPSLLSTADFRIFRGRLCSFARGNAVFLTHQTNILLHALTAVLVACLALCITQQKLAGFVAGLFFAAQPWQVAAAAAWIGGRTDVPVGILWPHSWSCLFNITARQRL